MAKDKPQFKWVRTSVNEVQLRFGKRIIGQINKSTVSNRYMYSTSKHYGTADCLQTAKDLEKVLIR